MKIAIISGASSGIGRSIAKNIDELGLDEFWLIGRSTDRLTMLKDEIKTSSRCFSLDLTENDAIKTIVDALKNGEYTVEHLVLSAGVGYNGAFEELSLEGIENTIDVNCTALTMLACAVVPYVGEGGKIINIASGAGFLPQPNFSVYAASKAYVISFSKALRQELKARKIKVTAVCPGPVDTDFFAGLDNVKEYKKRFVISPERVAEGSLKAVNKNKTIYTPTISMKFVHLLSKLIPNSLILTFYK